MKLNLNQPLKTLLATLAVAAALLALPARVHAQDRTGEVTWAWPGSTG